MKRFVDGLLILAAIAVVGGFWRLTERVSAIEETLTARTASSPIAEIASVRPIGIVIGDPEAPVTVVQFTDYECPFCAKFAAETLPALYDEYIQTKRLRLVIRDFPLPMHPNAGRFAMAARCAADQSPHNYEFQSVLYQTASEGEFAAMSAAAEHVGLNFRMLQECVSSNRYQADVEADLAEGTEVGLTGTPTFVVGKTDDPITGPIIRGAVPMVRFSTVIDSILADM